MGADRLFNIETHRWRSLRPPPCTDYCVLTGVGARWLSYTDPPQDCTPDTCPEGYNPLPPATYYQNIRTGESGYGLLGAGDTIDLDSPSLVRKLCPFGIYGHGFLLTPEQLWNGPPSYLRRCGSTLNMLLAHGAYAADSAAIVTSFELQQMGGILLPSLRPFEFSLPTVMHVPFVVLTPWRVFVEDNYFTDHPGPLWSASLPLASQRAGARAT
jgi:hypothetical protein